jgi:LPPG:FO 2-phospho-L-lactate transferase
LIVLLSGGTGGAKLARGLLDHLGPGKLAVIANTGDDIAAFGLHVSPDPDLVTYWLAGVIDERRGYGIEGETFNSFDQRVRLGAADWFRLGDADLATCLMRTELLHEGLRLTDITRSIAEAFGVQAEVLPMSDGPVQTYVRTEGVWRHFQEYLILQHAQPRLEGVEFRGASEAALTGEIQAVIESAEAIVIGPSNPIASIGPILAVPGMREAIAASPAPVLAVSPYVAGEVVKGPTNRFMRAVGRPLTAAGVASLYAGLIDAMVVDKGDPDPAPEEIQTLATATLMEGASGRLRLARVVLDYASELAAASR